MLFLVQILIRGLLYCRSQIRVFKSLIQRLVLGTLATSTTLLHLWSKHGTKGSDYRFAYLSKTINIQCKLRNFVEYYHHPHFVPLVENVRLYCPKLDLQYFTTFFIQFYCFSLHPFFILPPCTLILGLILYRGTICGLTEKTPFLYRYFKVLGQKIIIFPSQRPPSPIVLQYLPVIYTPVLAPSSMLAPSRVPESDCVRRV